MERYSSGGEHDFRWTWLPAVFLECNAERLGVPRLLKRNVVKMSNTSGRGDSAVGTCSSCHHWQTAKLAVLVVLVPELLGSKRNTRVCVLGMCAFGL